MAQFIAEGAVQLSRSGGKEADEAIIRDAAAAAETMQTRLSDAETAWQTAAGAHSAEALRLEVSDLSFLRSRVEEELLDEQADLAGQAEAQRVRRAPPSGLGTGSCRTPFCAGSSEDQPDQARRARVELLQRRIGELTLAVDQKSAALARQTAREEDLQAVLTAARASYQASVQRLADLQLARGSRSEWLRVVDPGIIPQRPSSPNLPLMLIGAASLALFGSLLYLTISFSLTRTPGRYRPPLRMATHGAD
jgi:hypothetical protein